jgi:hypothetical protein
MKADSKLRFQGNKEGLFDLASVESFPPAFLLGLFHYPGGGGYMFL